MKKEAQFVALGDVVVFGKRRYEVTQMTYNSGGLGDWVRFKLRNLRTGKETVSDAYAHECLLEVAIEEAGV